MRSAEIKTFIKSAESKGIQSDYKDHQLTFRSGEKSIVFLIADEQFDFERYKHQSVIPLDFIVTSADKLISLLKTKLQLNKKIFARQCEIRKVDKETALNFLEKYHLMNATSSASNFALYFKEELIALASFSKGRKMNRLEEHQRSYELIRFCTKAGYTVTGGLSKLLHYFCEEKNAGDIMTYVDKQFSDGTSFIRAGFKKHSETLPNYFLVNRKTFSRIPWERDKVFDLKKFYKTQNSGNIKFIFTPGE